MFDFVSIDDTDAQSGRLRHCVTNEQGVNCFCALMTVCDSSVRPAIAPSYFISFVILFIR